MDTTAHPASTMPRYTAMLSAVKGIATPMCAHSPCRRAGARAELVQTPGGDVLRVGFGGEDHRGGVGIAVGAVPVKREPSGVGACPGEPGAAVRARAVEHAAVRGGEAAREADVFEEGGPEGVGVLVGDLLQEWPIRERVAHGLAVPRGVAALECVHEVRKVRLACAG
eukprot:1195827-Prorocentrum_minimum.AAC.1